MMDRHVFSAYNGILFSLDEEGRSDRGYNMMNLEDTVLS